MNNPLKGRCMYVTMDTAVRTALISMLERKSGVKKDHDGGGCSLQKIDGDHIWNGNFGREWYKEITLTELEDLPDYVEEKELTVSEISEKLGYKVKVIEG